MYSYRDNCEGCFHGNTEKAGLMLHMPFQWSSLQIFDKEQADSQCSTLEERYTATVSLPCRRMIDGYTYTNSLEALEQSYRSGFRLLELDISQTSDGPMWRSMIGRTGKK